MGQARSTVPRVSSTAFAPATAAARGGKLPGSRSRCRHEHRRRATPFGVRGRPLATATSCLKAPTSSNPAAGFPGLSGTALCLVRPASGHDGGRRLPPSPRQVLRASARSARPSAAGRATMVGFRARVSCCFRGRGYEECRAKGYRDLRPANALTTSTTRFFGSTLRSEPVLGAA